MLVRAFIERARQRCKLRVQPLLHKAGIKEGGVLAHGQIALGDWQVGERTDWAERRATLEGQKR